MPATPEPGSVPPTGSALPTGAIEHRRDDGEVLGWMIPDDDGFTVLDRLGRPITDGPIEWLDAEELLDERGLGYLADRYRLTFADGTQRPVRITAVSTDGIVVLADEYGGASAVGSDPESFDLPFPAPDTLQPW